MLLANAVLLAEARSYVAALADQAGTFEGALAYEEVLLQLDALCPEGAPPHVSEVLTRDREVLLTVAERTIEDLGDRGFDRLEVELVQSMLGQARVADAS